MGIFDLVKDGLREVGADLNEAVSQARKGDFAAAFRKLAEMDTKIKGSQMGASQRKDCSECFAAVRCRLSPRRLPLLLGFAGAGVGYPGIPTAIVLLLASSLASSGEKGWEQSELTQQFMESLTKDECMDKSVASLEENGPSEKFLKTLAGTTGDCVTWARGSEEEFCRSYQEEYIGGICSVNALDARDCIFLHNNFEVICMTAKYE